MTLLWLDLETTGLDPQNDRILEIAWVITDSALKSFDLGTQSVVIQPEGDTFALLKANPFVLDMHTKTGLAADLSDPRKQNLLEAVEDFILEDMGVHEDNHSEATDEPWFLAGASVHFDLAFLRTWTPKLAAKLSHRVYDTSTLKAFFDPLLEQLGVEHGVINEGQHRALNDVEETLAVARFYYNFASSAFGQRSGQVSHA